MKDDPLQQNYGDAVRSEMAKHTLWLNAENFEEMVQASWDGYCNGGLPAGDGPFELPTKNQWRAMCAAALAVAEWRMGGRVRP